MNDRHGLSEVEARGIPGRAPETLPEEGGDGAHPEHHPREALVRLQDREAAEGAETSDPQDAASGDAASPAEALILAIRPYLEGLD